MSTSESIGTARPLPVYAKLTFLGPQTKPVPTLVIFAAAQAPPLAMFVAFQRNSRVYDNDDLAYTSMIASTYDEMTRLLHAEKALLENPAATGAPLLSLTVVVKTQDGSTGQEFLVRESSVEDFYLTAIDAMDPDSGAARQALREQATRMGVPPPSPTLPSARP